MRRYNEQRMVLILLSCALILAVILAVTFAALYVRDGSRSAGDALPDGANPEAEIAALRNQNEYLSSRLAEYEKAAETQTPALPPETENPSAHEPEAPPPEPVLPDPGDLLPRDPETLSYTFDLETQLALIREIEDGASHPPFIVDPDGEIHLLSEFSFDEDTEILYREKEGSAYDADGKPLEREIDYEAMGYRFPTVSVSYRDMERGTTYAFQGDQVYFSASLIKAPYIYTLLEQIAQYNAIKKANPGNDPAVGQTLSEETWEKYDLERKIRLTEDRIAKGSGKIKDMDLSGEGKEFTILELIQYSIKFSDNTAFRVLRDEFGYSYFWSVSKKLGVESVFTSFNNLTAKEAVLYLSAIYDFAKEYPYEGGILIGLMKNANHQVLIPAALGWTGQTAHKYGWDENAYHDMALVYGDAPYAVCIMTDFDFESNNDDINDYINSLVKKIDALHKSFYREP